MIPILYSGTETTFTSNGLGRLADAISCNVVEERNATYELEMKYPVSGVHFVDIKEGRIILAKPFDGGTPQPFIIYQITRPLNQVVTIRGQHISYMLSGIVVMPFTAGSITEALEKIVTYSATPNSFTFITDKSVVTNYKLETPRGCRSVLGGESGSILDVYGKGDYEFDRFTVKLWVNRGTDNGVTLRYGKNITDLSSAIDMTNVYTGIAPYWIDESGDNMVTLPEKVVMSDHADDYPYKIVKPVDFSSSWEEAPTENELRTKAQTYVANNEGWKLKNSIKVSFVALWNTEEYKNIAPLERVKMCDQVSVVVPAFGINVKTKVIKTDYNVLLERYNSITLGDTYYSLNQIIDEKIGEVETDQTSRMQKAINHATELITGGLGGHVVFNMNADGEPQEILIMDTDDMSTAVNVIRMNRNGIGFSTSGYNGPFTTAWTIDSHFNADFITAGELSANRVRAGLLTDELGYNYWNLDTGAFSLSAAATVGGDTVQNIANTAAGNAQTAAEQTAAAALAEAVRLINLDIDDLQEQIDGNITTWYYPYAPTLSNIPASQWTTVEEKNNHIGDLFYNKDTGYCYRFLLDGVTYKWVQISDEDIAAALEAANHAQDTADGKRRVFVATPVPPYDVGDLWSQGSNGDLLRCATAKAEGETYSASDWVKASKYTDDAAFEAFRDGSYATFVTNTNNAIAGKITTFYQASAPTANVTGDLWIDTDDGNKLYRWNGSAWGSVQDAGIQSALTAASNAQTTADGKIVTFAQASAPTATDVGDLWIDTDANNAMYRWNGTTWESVTDISALQTWITGTYASDKSDLQSQIDGKIQTWYQNTDPASAWDTTAKKEAHLGDLWYRTTDRVTLIYQKQNSIYVWLEENVPFAVFDKIDGKAQVFLTQPTPPYFVGDLWFEGASGGIKTCTQARIQYETYHASDWDYKNNYIDQSAITAYDTSLNQTAVFNKLTNNGTLQGIYMDQGDLYINASYIAAGTIADTSGNTSWNLTTGALSSKKLSVQSTNFTLTEAGVITATGATLNNATITSTNQQGAGLDVSPSELSFKYNNTEIASIEASRRSNNTYLDINSDYRINLVSDQAAWSGNYYSSKVYIGNQELTMFTGNDGAVADFDIEWSKYEQSFILGDQYENLGIDVDGYGNPYLTYDTVWFEAGTQITAISGVEITNVSRFNAWGYRA